MSQIEGILGAACLLDRLMLDSTHSKASCLDDGVLLLSTQPSSPPRQRFFRRLGLAELLDPPPSIPRPTRIALPRLLDTAAPGHGN